jgi:hypothetical protein
MESRSSRSRPRTLAHRAVTQPVIVTDPDAGVNESSRCTAALAASEVRRTVVALLSRGHAAGRAGTRGGLGRCLPRHGRAVEAAVAGLR